MVFGKILAARTGIGGILTVAAIGARNRSQRLQRHGGGDPRRQQIGDDDTGLFRQLPAAGRHERGAACLIVQRIALEIEERRQRLGSIDGLEGHAGDGLHKLEQTLGTGL